MPHYSTNRCAEIEYLDTLQELW